MARRVFFSFHYDRDILRVGQVRNSGMTKPSVENAGFIDQASWESLKRQDNAAIERWINNQLDGTSVTVVLIGRETSESDWVKYEIKQSHKKGNGLLGIYIHNVKDMSTRQTDIQGKNPFDTLSLRNDDGTTTPLSRIYKTYDWINDNGYENFASWVEAAARQSGN